MTAVTPLPLTAIAGFASLALVLVAPAARADSSPGARVGPAPDAGAPGAVPLSLRQRPFEEGPAVTGWGVAGYGAGLGVGGRGSFPVAEGVLQDADVRDSFGLELGADYLRFHAGSEEKAVATSVLRPVAGLLWSFRFNQAIALYPKLEVGWGLAEHTGPANETDHAGLHVEGVGGVLYSLGAVTIRAETGWGYFKGGLGFTL